MALTKEKNTSEIKDFTEGNLTSHIIKFALPILLSYFFMITLNTVDMVVVGQKYGEAGTSAVAIGASVAMFINAVLTGFSSAIQVIISRFVGSMQSFKISRFVSTVCSFMLLLAIASMGIMIPLIDTMLSLLNTPSEAYTEAYGYSLVCLCGIIPIFAYHVISAILRGMGDSKHPFYFIAIACSLNIALDVLFVTVLDLGVKGAALATVLAQLVSVLCSVTLLIRKRADFGLTMKPSDFVYWERGSFFDFIKLGIPMALNTSAIQIAVMAVNAMTNDFGVSVSAFAGIKANIDTTFTLIIEAFTIAAAMVIGQNLAAGKIKRVKRSMLTVGVLSVSLSILVSLLFLLFPYTLFGIFSNEENVLAIVKEYLPIMVLGFFAMGIRPITKSLVDGSGNKSINIINALLDAVAARIGLAIVFGILLDWGYVGFWFGAALASFVPIIVEVIFFLSGAWKKSVILEIEEI